MSVCHVLLYSHISICLPVFILPRLFHQVFVFHCRSEGPTILRHHEGSVSSCAFSRDGKYAPTVYPATLSGPSQARC